MTEWRACLTLALPAPPQNTAYILCFYLKTSKIQPNLLLDGPFKNDLKHLCVTV